MENIKINFFFAVLFAITLGEKHPLFADEKTKMDTNVKAKVQAVEVLTVKKQQFDYYQEFMGTTSGINEVSLVSIKGGRVSEINADIGTKVKKGDRICNIESDNARLNLKLARLQEKTVKDTLARTKNHINQGTSSRIKRERDEMDLLQAQYRLMEAEKVFQSSVCTVPIDGIVTNKYISLFEEIRPGKPTFHIVNFETMKVEIEVGEDDFAGFQSGSIAELRLSPNDKRVWQGNVKTISLKVDSNNRTIPMEIHFPNKDQRLISGLTAHIKVLKKSISDAVLVPSHAIQIRDGKQVVMLVKDSKVAYQVVSLGPENGLKTMISSGIKGGDEVIIVGSHMVNNGQSVKIVKRYD